MARKGNYGWEKRQREIKKQKKKEAKAEKKRALKEAEAAANAPPDPDELEPGAEDGTTPDVALDETVA